MWKTAISRAARLTDLMSVLAPTGAHRVGWAVVNLVAVIAAFIPLFDLVGYESAALFGVILGLASIGLTVWSVRTKVVDPPLSEDRDGSPAADFGLLAVRHLAMAVGPLLILSLNAVRVPNCDWSAGFGFWALIVGPAILLGQTAGWVAATVVSERPAACWSFAFLLPLGDVAFQLQHLAIQPPIITHQWFVGYFSGSIYDEALAVPPSLIAYRGLQIVAIIAIVAAIEAIWKIGRDRRPIWTTALAVGAAVVFAVGFAHRPELGIAVDRDHVVDTLGATVESEHFVIHYPNRRPYTGRVDEMVADHEFRYHQLRRFFDTDPIAESDRKIRSFVYGDRDTKNELMGGRSTMVSKLWLHQMHILWSETGDTMLTHELAHIFTEPFGAGPLRLSMQRVVGVNMGLVEGVAVAAEWPTRQLTPHEASAGMRRHDIDPNLDDLLSASSFWTEASGPAYTAMGSFVRYLIDEYGIESFKQAYPRGDFSAAYERDIEELVEEWEEFVDGIELTDRQLDAAAHRYDRVSIFEKVCARALAERRRRAREAHSQGALEEAKRLYDAVLADDPGDVSSHRSRIRILIELQRFDEALEAIEERPHRVLSRVDEGRFLELKGDVLWLKGEPRAAVSVYDEALEQGATDPRERSLVIKRRLAQRDDDRGRRYLVDRADRAPVTYLLSEWTEDEPEDPIPAYLMGRRLWSRDHCPEAFAHLERARGRMDNEALDAEAALMLGQCYLFEECHGQARAVFDELTDADRSRYRQAAHHWLERVDWTERNTPSEP